MMRLFYIFALVVLPRVGFAQDTPFDAQLTQACLAEAVDIAAKRDCIGLSAAACADASVGGFNTRSMTACMGDELALFDALLNTEYAQVRKLAAELDKQEGGASFDPVSMVDRLVQMQRAWIAFRDATCAYEQRQFDGGTLGRLVQVDCMATMTAEQAFRLQNNVLGL